MKNWNIIAVDGASKVAVVTFYRTIGEGTLSIFS